jgi:hypothetical protein
VDQDLVARGARRETDPIDRNGARQITDPSASEDIGKPHKLKTDAYRRKYHPELKPVDRSLAWARVYVEYDPKAFKAIDVRNRIWPNIDTANMSFRALKGRLRYIWSRYKAVAEDKISGQSSLMHIVRARQIKHRVDADAEVDFVLANMHPDTKWVLNEPRSSLNHQRLLQMAPITGSDLRKWVVYLVWYVLPDGSIWIYIGSATARGGSWFRLWSQYEVPLWYLQHEMFHGAMKAPGGVKPMLSHPKGTQMHVRVLASFDIPQDDPVEYERIKKIVLRTEALFMDDLCAIQKGQPGKTVNIGDQEIDSMDVEALTRSFRPAGEQHKFNGHNKTHPFTISFKARRVARGKSDKAKARLATQDHTCRLDLRPLPSTQHVIKNMFLGQIPGFDDAYLCRACWKWWYRSDQATRDRALACRTLDDLIAARHSGRTKGTSLDQMFAKQTACQVCTKDFVPRPASHRYLVSGNKTPRRQKGGPRIGWRTKVTRKVHKRYPALKKIMICCHECWMWLTNGNDRDGKAPYNELTNPKCEIKRFRELMAYADQRKNKKLVLVNITPGEKCRCCHHDLRQMVAGEKICDLREDRDPLIQSTGLDIPANARKAVTVLGNFQGHVCLGCRKVMQKRNEAACPAHLKWAKDISWADICSDIGKARGINEE